ncbi:hypothetical protein ACM26V_02670 [Salipaludibacillus sp. HK11]|uniref:hypothetical protein n=1 Tax=Salipaludibacillus sp. HK11 TaxID=3394320 RepID=UPI0039FCFF48
MIMPRWKSFIIVASLYFLIFLFFLIYGLVTEFKSGVQINLVLCAILSIVMFTVVIVLKKKHPN